MITVLLLNYKREENLPRIISDLRQQTVPCEIILWNNAEKPLHHQEVDWTIDSTQNLKCWPRWFVAQYAKNDFVMTLDDDLTLKSNDSLEHILNQVKHAYKKGRAFGLFGVQYKGDKKYLKSRKKQETKKGVNYHVLLPSENAVVDIIKGRCFIFNKKDLKNLPLDPGFGRDMCDDLIASYFLAQGKKRHHIVIGGMAERVEELKGGEDEMALSSSDNWGELRSEVMNKYYRKNLFSKIFG